MTWTITRGTGPIVITAIHAGHGLRDELLPYMALDDGARLREEDPFTDQWTALSSRRVVVETSRFEVDLNRAAADAIYTTPEDAWGLDVWKSTLPDELLRRSRSKWQTFYADMATYLDAVHDACGPFVVLDIHSYCHRRGGPLAAPADSARNPDVNLGTGSIHDPRWAPLIARMLSDLRAYEIGQGQHLDARENVNFRGGYFSRWINQRYGGEACAIAIEFKKTFMDEWTGQLDRAHLASLIGALASTLPGIGEKIALTAM